MKKNKIKTYISKIIVIILHDIFFKEEIMKKFFIFLILIFVNILYSDQIIKESKDKNQKFSVGGEANFLSRTNSYHPQIDPQKGIYPSDSFAYTSMKIYGDYNYKNLILSLGYFGGVSYGYNGWYPFPDDTHTKMPSPYWIEFHRFLFYRAFIGYDSDKLYLRLGRFITKDDDWIKSTIEGAQVIYNFNDNFSIRSIVARAFTTAFGAWVWDFNNSKSPTGFYNLAFQAKNDNFLIRPYINVVPLYYTMPGIKLGMYFGDQDTISYTTDINIAGMFYEKLASSIPKGVNPFGDVGKSAGNIFIRQSINFYNTYGLSLGLYQNLGNFNAMIGTYGTPADVGIYDGSYFAAFWLNEIFARSATTALFNASWKVLPELYLSYFFRFSNSYRSYELSTGFNVGYDLTKAISFKGQLAFYPDWTRAGYSTNSFLPEPGVPANLADRSYFMLQISYKL